MGGAAEGVGEKAIDKTAAEHPAEYEKRLEELAKAARRTGGGSVHLQDQRALQRIQRIMNDPAKRPIPPQTAKPVERDELEKGTAAKGRMERPSDPSNVVELRPTAEESIGSRSSKAQEKATEEKQPLPGALGRDKRGRFTKPVIAIEKPAGEKLAAEKPGEDKVSEKTAGEAKAAKGTGVAPEVHPDAKPLPPATIKEKMPLAPVDSIVDPAQRSAAGLIATDIYMGKPRLRISDVREAARALEEIKSGATEFSNPAMVKRIQANPSVITAEAISALEAGMNTSPLSLASRGTVRMPIDPGIISTLRQNKLLPFSPPKEFGEEVSNVFELKLPDDKLGTPAEIADAKANDNPPPTAAAAAAAAKGDPSLINLADSSKLNESKFIPRALQEEILKYDNRRKKSGYARVYLQAESEVPGKPGKIYVVATDGVAGIKLGMRMPIGGDKIGARVVAFGDSNNTIGKAAITVWRDMVNSFAPLLSKVIGKKFTAKAGITETTIMDAEDEAEKRFESSVDGKAIALRLGLLSGVSGVSFGLREALQQCFHSIAAQVNTYIHGAPGWVAGSGLTLAIGTAAYARGKELVLTRTNRSLNGFLEDQGFTLHPDVVIK